MLALPGEQARGGHPSQTYPEQGQAGSLPAIRTILQVTPVGLRPLPSAGPVAGVALGLLSWDISDHALFSACPKVRLLSPSLSSPSPATRWEGLGSPSPNLGCCVPGVQVTLKPQNWRDMRGLGKG